MDEVTLITGGLLISKVRLMEEDNEVRCMVLYLYMKPDCSLFTKLLHESARKVIRVRKYIHRAPMRM